MKTHLRDFFSFQPTPSQQQLIELFDQFITVDQPKKTLVIRGYAGTGKTQVIDAIVKYLTHNNRRLQLMAPTGRAAKVMEKYTNVRAYTIQSQIFKYKIDQDTEQFIAHKKKNYFNNAVFIVDEASMISDEGYNGLLTHLQDYIFSGHNNSLILVGDGAQLSPVDTEHSYGLDIEYLRNQFNLFVFDVELTDVMRQNQNSGILYNANYLRQCIHSDKFQNDINFRVKPFKDIYCIPPDKLVDGLRYSYDKYGIENVMLLTKSNWGTIQYNQLIRHSILFFEHEIEGGDMLLVTKNNYYYDLDNDQGNFIANGNLLYVKRVIDTEEIYGFRFATIELLFSENINNGNLSFVAKICLDMLHESKNLGQDTIFQQLTQLISEQYSDIKDAKEKADLIKSNEYHQALHVKYAYALTTHKAQGGQWKTIFLDTNYHVGKNNMSVSYLRWLYTGFTRAQEELYLLNVE